MRRRTETTRRGAALVEMALVLPIFLAVVLGIIEFGRAMMVAQLLTNGAREGARLAIVEGTTESDVVTRVRDFLVAAANVTDTDVSVSVTVTAGPGNPAPGSLANAQSGDLVSVLVQVPFEKVKYIPGDFLEGKLLEGQASMRHE